MIINGDCVAVMAAIAEARIKHWHRVSIGAVSANDVKAGNATTQIGLFE